MFSREHTPVKYGFDSKSPPPVPTLGQGGSFSSSFDNRLWMFSRRWEPAGKAKATLIIVHGTVDHSGVYAELATELANTGVAVFAMDMRGWGLSDGESIYFNDVETFVADVAAFYKKIHSLPKYSSVKPRFLLGKSLGGTVTAYTVAKHPKLFTGLLGLSGAYDLDPGLQPSRVTNFILKLLYWIVPKLPLKQLFDPKLIVSNENALQKWRDDPLCSKDKVRVGYAVELQRCCRELPTNVVRTLDIPMLMMIGTADQVVTLSGHKTMTESSLDKDTTLKTYEGGYHNLLAEPKLKDLVMHDIVLWILARTTLLEELRT